MGLFGKKKDKQERKEPLIIDPDAFLIDKGRTLASQDRFMEAVMVFEQAEDSFRQKLASGRSSNELLSAGFYAAALGNHALVLAKNLHRPDDALPIARKAIAVIKKYGLRSMLEEHERILQTVEDLLASS